MKNRMNTKQKTWLGQALAATADRIEAAACKTMAAIERTLSAVVPTATEGISTLFDHGHSLMRQKACLVVKPVACANSGFAPPHRGGSPLQSLHGNGHAGYGASACASAQSGGAVQGKGRIV
jgi:hypothetical protein